MGCVSPATAWLQRGANGEQHRDDDQPVRELCEEVVVEAEHGHVEVCRDHGHSGTGSVRRQYANAALESRATNATPIVTPTNPPSAQNDPAMVLVVKGDAWMPDTAVALRAGR